MKDFILFMYDDVTDPAVVNDDERWSTYFSRLRASGHFDGGSSIGAGRRFKKNNSDTPSVRVPTGYIRVRAQGLAEATEFLTGNPVYEAGGTVEVRELPRED